jgi:hypothetical protein
MENTVPEAAKTATAIEEIQINRDMMTPCYSDIQDIGTGRPDLKTGP